MEALEEQSTTVDVSGGGRRSPLKAQVTIHGEHAMHTTTATPAETQTARITSTADQLAVDLRTRRNFHDGEPCDAFALCLSCRTGGRTVVVGRHVAAIPTQRTKENR